jgi:hypothetical protein
MVPRSCTPPRRLDSSTVYCSFCSFADREWPFSLSGDMSACEHRGVRLDGVLTAVLPGTGTPSSLSGIVLDLRGGSVIIVVNARGSACSSDLTDSVIAGRREEEFWQVNNCEW